MAEHERMCFAEAARMPMDHLDIHFMTQGPPKLAQLANRGAVFFGGSGAYSVLDDIPWIHQTIDLMLEIVQRKIPAYASCFGFQGLSMALGGTVVHDDDLTEMGSVELELTEAGHQCPLFSTLPNPFWAQEGHHDHVIELPAGVTLLARGNQVAAQAFRVDGAPFWASQFHPELNLSRTIERFLHYAAHYLDGDANAEQERLEELQKNEHNSPEVPELLARIVRYSEFL